MKIETNAPIDFVVTWVDGEDPAWCAQKAEWLAKVDTEATTDWLAGDKRYRDWGLLRYWFRRFITPKLKEMESLVLNAETKINKLEYDIFVGIRDEIEKHIEIIQKTSENIAVLDVLCSFATCSNELGYVKPLVDDSLTLEIRKGRHPVIERTTEQGLFVSNDTYMDDRNSSMLIITGPNMAGKSTYMRQTALIGSSSRR